MGVISAAIEAASTTKAGVAASAVGVTTTVWHLAAFPWSLVTEIGTAVLVMFHLIAALPRVVRTLVALKQRVFNRKPSLWKRLEDQPVSDSD
jgi:hypothetical protein